MHWEGEGALRASKVQVHEHHQCAFEIFRFTTSDFNECVLLSDLRRVVGWFEVRGMTIVWKIVFGEGGKE